MKYISQYSVRISRNREFFLCTEGTDYYKNIYADLLGFDITYMYGVSSLLLSHKEHIRYVKELIEADKKNYYFEDGTTFSYRYTWHQEMIVDCDLNYIYINLFGLMTKISLNEFLTILISIENFLERVSNSFKIVASIKHAWRSIHNDEVKKSSYIRSIIDGKSDFLIIGLCKTDFELTPDEYISTLDLKYLKQLI